MELEVDVGRREAARSGDRRKVDVAELERDLARDDAATTRARADALAQTRQHRMRVVHALLDERALVRDRARDAATWIVLAKRGPFAAELVGAAAARREHDRG